MIARALRIGMFPQIVAAVRSTGKYLSGPYGARRARLFDVVWDAATSRLIFNYADDGLQSPVFSTVSSAAQTVAYKGSGTSRRLAVYNVTTTGLAADPVADYPISSVAATDTYHANGEYLTITSDGAAAAAYTIRNFIDGSASTVAMPRVSNFTTWSTGDEFVARTRLATGEEAGLAPCTFPSGTDTSVTVRYNCDSTGSSPASRLRRTGPEILPFSGVPRLLGSANTVFDYTVSLPSTNDATSNILMRAGSVTLPCTLVVTEVDIQAGANGPVVSVGRATWNGMLRMGSATADFTPLFVSVARQTAACSVVVTPEGYRRYNPRSGAWQLGSLGRSGKLTAVLGNVAFVSQGAQFTSFQLPGATIILDKNAPELGFQIYGLPHLGALVLTYFNSTTEVHISFDNGATFKRAALWNTTAGANLRSGADLTLLRAAVPVFNV